MKTQYCCGMRMSLVHIDPKVQGFIVYEWACSVCKRHWAVIEERDKNTIIPLK